MALNKAIKDEGIPALDLWSTILGRDDINPLVLTLCEDNQAAAQIVRTGKTPSLRHVKRVHGISISFLTDLYPKKLFTLSDCHTKPKLPICVRNISC